MVISKFLSDVFEEKGPWNEAWPLENFTSTVGFESHGVIVIEITWLFGVVSPFVRNHTNFLTPVAFGGLQWT